MLRNTHPGAVTTIYLHINNLQILYVSSKKIHFFSPAVPCTLLILNVSVHISPELAPAHFYNAFKKIWFVLNVVTTQDMVRIDPNQIKV